MANRLLTVLFVLALVIAACSSAGSRPTEFDDMTSDEVGCTVDYGNTDPDLVGPLGPGDAEEIEPNDFTSIHIGRTASDIVIVAKSHDGEIDGGMALNSMPADGVVARGSFSDESNPGNVFTYVVTCWRGDT